MVQPVIAATRLPAGLQNLAASGVVDIHAGLTPVMGNGEAYIALLRRYAMDRADDVRLLRRQLGEGKAVDALRTLHTLKGTAATIGAFGLEAAAIDAEAGLKRGSLAAALEPQLQGLEVAQAALLEALDRALPPPFTADGDAFDADSAQSLLVKLRALCAEDDIEAFNLYRNNAPLLRALLADDAPGIEARIDAFQFDQALALLHAATMRAD
jgi:two-component system sensor histidine kinase/response regulator